MVPPVGQGGSSVSGSTGLWKGFLSRIGWTSSESDSGAETSVDAPVKVTLSSTSPVQPKTLSFTDRWLARLNRGLEVVSGWGQRIMELLPGAEETQKTINEAKAEAATATTAEARAAAKAKAGAAAKEGLKAAVNARVATNSLTPEQATEITSIIDNWSDDRAIATFVRLKSAMAVAQEQNNEEAFKAAASQLNGFLQRIVANHRRLEGRVHDASDGAIRTFSVGVKHFNARDMEVVRKSAGAPASKEEEAQINQAAKRVEERNQLATSIEVSASTEYVAASAPVMAELHEGIVQTQELATAIIEVANAKGYTLDNYDALAAIATSGISTEVIATSDPSQIAVLGRVKQILNTVLDDVNKLLMEARQENARNERVSQKIVAEQRAIDKAELEKIRQKTEELKKLLAMIQDRKLQQDLHTQVEVLTYLLEHPEEISQARLDEMRDQINRIKWQIIGQNNNNR